VRILHVTPAFYPALVYGGPMRSLYDLCRALADAGEHVRVLTTDANGTGRVEAAVGAEVTWPTGRGASVQVRYARRRAGHTVSPELLRVLPGYVRWSEVVHLTAVYSFPTLPTLLVARRCGRPVVVSPRGSFGRWGQARRRWKKVPANALLQALARRGVLVHATAEPEALDVRRCLGDVPTVVVPNGVDAAEFATVPAGSGAWLRGLASLKPEDGPLLGCLGRLHPKKGLERLVGALPRLARRWPRVQALLAGPDAGAEQARLAALALALGVGDRVRFLGAMYGAERISFLAGLDVFVLPSFDENFANAVAESLAAATPVVASRQCPWPELESRGCGRWVEPEAEAVAEAVESILLGDHAAMGERGRAFILAERTMAPAAERMREVYRALVRRS
jgi:glycosyltransferase involved in cell wall biosynthesis